MAEFHCDKTQPCYNTEITDSFQSAQLGGRDGNISNVVVTA